MNWKRILALIMCCALCFTAVPTVSLAAGRDTSQEEKLAADLKALSLFKGVSDTNFDLNRAPSRAEALVMLIRVLGKESDALNGSWKHPFTDVPAWADKYIGYAYQSGLTNGISATEFGAGDANAAMYLTFVLRALGYSYNVGLDFTWNDPFSLAKNIGILPSGVDTINFWRADVVSISYAALQVTLKASEQTLAQKLISLGVFTQEAFDSVYDPDALTSSQESTLPPTQPPSGEKLTAEQISEKCANAVFYIDIFALNGEIAGSGSGFFISADGLAITNYHVATNSSELHVTTADGTVYTDVKIIDSDGANDLALLKVNGGPFPYVSLGDSSTVKQGQTVYAIGSPIGLQNTLSQGLISNTKRIVDGVEYFQFSAQIFSGSSGGALFNEYGQVIGVTTAGYINAGADLNLAIPVNKVKDLNKSSSADLFLWTNTMYSGFEDILDFGAFTGADVIEANYTLLGYHFTYNYHDFHATGKRLASENFAWAIYHYTTALKNRGLIEAKEGSVTIYYSDEEVIYIELNGDKGIIDVWVEEWIQYYAEFPQLPDFGWYMEIGQHEKPSAIGNSIMYSYYWPDYDYTKADFEMMLEWYFALLESNDYICKYNDGNSWLYEGQGISVVFSYSKNRTSFYIDVAKIQ